MREGREKVNELEEKIKKVCGEVYGRSGNEMIELIEKIYYIELRDPNKPYTIDICKMVIKMINKDKERKKKC